MGNTNLYANLDSLKKQVALTHANTIMKQSV